MDLNETATSPESIHFLVELDQGGPYLGLFTEAEKARQERDARLPEYPEAKIYKYVDC